MGLKIGVLATQHIAVGVVEENRIVGQMRIFPEGGNKSDYLADMHAEEIAEQILQQIARAREGKAVEAVGVGFPGIIRDGIIEESPNLHQMKGQNLRATLTALLARVGINARVSIINDADAMAAGIAAERGEVCEELILRRAHWR